MFDFARCEKFSRSRLVIKPSYSKVLNEEIVDLLFVAQKAWIDLETELKKSVRSANIPSTSIKEVRGFPLGGRVQPQQAQICGSKNGLQSWIFGKAIALVLAYFLILITDHLPTGHPKKSQNVTRKIRKITTESVTAVSPFPFKSWFKAADFLPAQVLSLSVRKLVVSLEQLQRTWVNF